MSLRPTATLARLGIAAAGGALAALTVTGPAIAADGADNDHPRLYKGRVTAKSGLLLRTAPTRGSAVIRSEPYGKVVHIFCKTTGDNGAPQQPLVPAHRRHLGLGLRPLHREHRAGPALVLTLLASRTVT